MKFTTKSTVSQAIALKVEWSLASQSTFWGFVVLFSTKKADDGRKSYSQIQTLKNRCGKQSCAIATPVSKSICMKILASQEGAFVGNSLSLQISS